MKNPKKRNVSDVALNLLLDTGIAVAVLLLLAHDLTGQALHEWIGIGFAVGVIAHLLLHWDWIVGTSKRLLHKMPGQVRLKTLINLAIFIDMALMIVSGLLISEVVLKPFGIEAGQFWKALHVTAANTVIWLVGLHVAMSWKWIVNAVKQHVGQPIARTVRQIVARKPAAAQS